MTQYKKQVLDGAIFTTHLMFVKSDENLPMLSSRYWYKKLCQMCQDGTVEEWKEVQKLFSIHINNTNTQEVTFHVGCYPWLSSLGFEAWYYKTKGIPSRHI